MFIGTTPREVRAIIAEILKKGEYTDVYVGCSGNFTIDKICSSLGLNVFSNDISLYSKIIADIVMGRDPKKNFTINEKFYKEIYESWGNSKYKELIFYLYVQNIIKFEKQDNDYKKYMFKIWVKKNKEFYSNTLKKIKKNKSLEFKIKDFFWGDFINHINKSPRNALNIIFPPTYKGGYEKIYKRLDEIFKHDVPEYKIFDPEKAGNLFEKLLKEKNIIIYHDRIIKKLKKNVIGEILYRGNRKDIYIYSNLRIETKIIRTNDKTIKNKYYKIIKDDFNFDENVKIQILKIKSEIVYHYKHLFMSLKVNDYSTDASSISYGFFLNGYLLGIASFNNFLGAKTEDYIFMVTDFVLNQNIKRLSKLLLYLLKSKDMQRIIIDDFKYFYKGIETSVYTDKPVSMKYRGAFKLLERNDGKLKYGADFEAKNIMGKYLEWLNKQYKR